MINKIRHETALQTILLEFNRPFALFEIADLAMRVFFYDDPEIIIDQFDHPVRFDGIVDHYIKLTDYGSGLDGDEAGTDLRVGWEYRWGGRIVTMSFDFMRAVRQNRHEIEQAANLAKYDNALKWLMRL